MLRYLSLPLLVPLLGTLLSASVAYATPYTLEQTLVVRLAPQMQLTATATLAAGTPTPSAAHLAQQLAELRAVAAEPILPGAYLLRYRAPLAPPQAAHALATLPGVIYAEPNGTRQIYRTPNDPAIREQWALTNIQAYDAWDLTTGSEDVIIAVIDTGVDANHEDLRGQVLPGYNAITRTGNAADDNGHGTAVSGLIAARTNNGTGIAGICWNCRILPVKALNRRGGGDDASVARAIVWAADNGAQIINMSLGGTSPSTVIHEAVQYATGRGILIVAASGNAQQDGNPTSYPAAYPEVLAVSSTSNNDAITGFANTGAYIDIAAPGVGLWTTLPDNEYGPPNGTSFSSPYVAGAAGLVRSLRPDLDGMAIKCVLEATTDDQGTPGKDDDYGWGRLNVFRAVQLAPSYQSCPLAAEPVAATTPPAFARVEPVAATPDVRYFAETGHTLRGAFKAYWEAHGGLLIFGYPISEEFVEQGSDGQGYIVQYFERHRFEYHPDQPPPYDVQLARLGDLLLEQQGRSWWDFPRTTPEPSCAAFAATGQQICEPFLSVWRSNGLEFDGQSGFSTSESLALFGQPISPVLLEEVAPGVLVRVQWFERARFEQHVSGVRLGLLSSELVALRGWRAP